MAASINGNHGAESTPKLPKMGPIVTATCRVGLISVGFLHEIDQLRSCFARVMIRRRIVKGWSQADLAGYCGLERSYVSRLEKEMRTPSLDVVFRLARAFGVAPQTLVKEVNALMANPRE